MFVLYVTLAEITYSNSSYGARVGSVSQLTATVDTAVSTTGVADTGVAEHDPSLAWPTTETFKPPHGRALYGGVPFSFDHV